MAKLSKLIRLDSIETLEQWTERGIINNAEVVALSRIIQDFTTLNNRHRLINRKFDSDVIRELASKLIGRYVDTFVTVAAFYRAGFAVTWCPKEGTYYFGLSTFQVHWFQKKLKDSPLFQPNV